MAEVEVRAARPEDRAGVVAFCERDAEDGDYISSAWDQWLADTAGALLVATRDGQPVGVAHLDLLETGEGWLEGLRVAREARRASVGRSLTRRVIEEARQRGARVIRLFTSSENDASQALFTGESFALVAMFMSYEAEAQAGIEQQAVAQGGMLRTPGEDERDRLWAYLGQSNLVPLNGGLLVEGWRARALTPALLQARLATGDVSVLEEWQTVQALALVQVPEVARRPTLMAQYLDGSAEGIGRLTLALRGEAARRGLERVVVVLPDALMLHDAMDGAGFAARHHGNAAIWCYASDLS